VSGREPWRSRGSTASTKRLRNINPGAGNAWPGGFVKHGQKVLFRAAVPDTNSELWAREP
jgi:ELWxxDGT repeat protein